MQVIQENGCPGLVSGKAVRPCHGIEYDGTLKMQVISIFPTSTTQDLRSLAPVTPYGQYKSACHRGGLVAVPEFHDSRSMLEEKGSLVPKHQSMLAWCLLLLLLLWHRPPMKNAEKQA